ncbi:MAG: hypothetical protein F6K39_23375 [Okeania sp. SIO3B3]|nr:hypothetical protein [Okeania sp. SIO3B3]
MLVKVKATFEIEFEQKVTVKVSFPNLRSNYSLLIAVNVVPLEEAS